jgi:indole-3-glycerol phosphate synthase
MTTSKAAPPTSVDILSKILATKRTEVAAAKLRKRDADLARICSALPPCRGLANALQRQPGAPVRILAEIKRASPSAGPIRPGAVPAQIAQQYWENGAAALSVLTDESYFDGHLDFLQQVRDAVPIPLLRKDFIIDDYQLLEARAAGADAVLLIVAALQPQELTHLHAMARDLGMDVLVEIHDPHELDVALSAGATLIGVNHRNLKTFTLDMSLTAQVAPLLPTDSILVAESGIKVQADVQLLGAVGAHAVLVGEGLMRAPSPGAALAALRGG